MVVGKGPEAVLTGPPVELVLYLFGRREASAAAVSGDPAARAVLESAPLGI